MKTAAEEATDVLEEDTYTDCLLKGRLRIRPQGDQSRRANFDALRWALAAEIMGVK